MSSPPSPEDGNGSSFRNVVLLLPRIPDDGKSPKTPLILCAVHHRQNPLKSTKELNLAFSHSWLWKVQSSGGVTPYNLVDIRRLFWRTYCIHLHNRWINQARNEQKFTCLLLTIRPWGWRQYFPAKCQWTYTTLDDVMYQQIIMLFRNGIFFPENHTDVFSSCSTPVWALVIASLSLRCRIVRKVRRSAVVFGGR
jgi:hypothetical protein